jgi:nucleoporin GLE1
LKESYLPTVKADPTLRSAWSRGRRGIVPKIGQLTNSQSEIDRITTAILRIILVQPPLPEPLYFSLLSALAKAILMQAETEVSARAVTAIPLAKVTLGLMIHLEFFSDVLYARMVQRTGGWAIPIPVGKPATMSEVEYKKLRGYRTEREGQKEFETRVAGITTLYFAILSTDIPQPLPPFWTLPRLWLYLTRLMSTPILLRSDLAMQVISGMFIMLLC